MTAFYDYCWFGLPDAVEAAIEGMTNVMTAELDGVAYAKIRSAAPLDLPPDLLAAGPGLSAAVFGLWAGQLSDVPERVTNYQGRMALMELPGSATGHTLFDDVDAFCKAAGGPVLQAWEQSNHFYRSSAFIAALETRFLPDLIDESGAVVQTSSARVDQVFRRGRLVA